MPTTFRFSSKSRRKCSASLSLSKQAGLAGFNESPAQKLQGYHHQIAGYDEHYGGKGNGLAEHGQGTPNEVLISGWLGLWDEDGEDYMEQERTVRTARWTGYEFIEPAADMQ